MAKKKVTPATGPAKKPMIVPYTKPTISAPAADTPSELETITASLSAEFDTLDTSLILALLSDYPPSTIPAELPNIRDQLAILQACSVPDDNDPNTTGFPTDPSASTSISDLTDLLDRAELSAQWESEDLPSPIRSPPPADWKEVHHKKGSKSGSSSASGSVSASAPSRPSGSRTGSYGQTLSVNGGQGSAGGSKAGSESGVGVGGGSVSRNGDSQKGKGKGKGTGSESGSGSGSAQSNGQSAAGWSAGESSSPTTVNEEAGLEDEMGLLQTLFPNLKTPELRTALDDAVSLQAAIDQLLSVELIKNVERDGVWPGEQNLTDEEFDDGPAPASSVPMSPSASAQSRSRPEKRQPKRHYALIDTLQRVPTPSSHSSSRAQSPARLSRTYGLSGPAPNAWHTLASLASQLAELLSPHPESYFVSYLHSPEYRSAHAAVHAALRQLPPIPLPADSASEAILQDLYGLSLTEEGDERKQRDLKAAMRVGGDDVGVVMDLVDLLEEISHWPQDEDVFDRYGSEDEYEIPADTFQTLPTPARPARTGFTSRTSDLPERIMRKPKRAPVEPSGPRFIPGAQPAASSASFPTARDDFGVPPPSPRRAPGLMPSNRRQVHLQNWRKVEHERLAPREPIAGPTYSHPTSSAPSLSVEDCLNNAILERHKRETAIRAAGMHFSGHLPGGKAVNASVAGHYASQARTAGDQARSWELRAARMVVGAQLKQTGHTVDLHHLIQAEAVTVAKEVVGDWYEKQRAAWGTGHGREGNFVVGRPMTIITGVGNHSAGKRGVLGPAVAGALEREGWKVERGENARGYLVIKGKR